MVHALVLCLKAVLVGEERLDSLLELTVQTFLLVSQLLVSGSEGQLSLLVGFEESAALREVLPEAPILEEEVVDLCLVAVESAEGLPVAAQEADLLLQRVVLLVQEVDLVGELADRLLVELVRVLDTEHLEALAALV